MSIWFLVWLTLSGVLLYFMFWTLFILYRQKKAWKRFAATNKLRYRSERTLSPPELSGVMKTYTVSVFTGEHVAADARRTRKLTAIEIQLATHMPFEGAVASGGMIQIVREFSFRQECRPENPAWQKNWMAASENTQGMLAYLTPERITALASLLNVKNAWVIFVFKDNMTLLRLDTPEPLDNEAALQRALDRMIATAIALELKPGEEESLRTEAVKKKDTAHITLDPPKEASGLSLEDDEPDHASETGSAKKP